MICPTCENFRYFKPCVFRGWSQLLRVGHGPANPGRPRLARPVVYSNRGPKPNPACEIPILPTVGQARFATFHLAGRLCPAWPVTSSGRFRVCLQAVTPSRNSETTTCSLARAQRCLWVAARCPQAAYEAESAMPLYRLSDTVGARWLRSALIRRDWRHDKCHEM